ncbi:MAG TPA: thiamine ABC transporter substrate-binding protein [Anaerolineales bacterium]|nr:thiamine ABC transporter substrate-binding protein [Anaerolineales bacterium]
MKRVFLLVGLVLSACAPVSGQTRSLTVMTHDSFSLSQSVVQAFEAANGVSVSFVKSGDAGAALNKAVLSRGSPFADVFFGVDNTFLTRALDADIFQPYDSPALAEIPASFKLDPSNRALPVDYGDVCINYDKAFFAQRALDVPQTLEDLSRPKYKDMLVVENPASSSPGLAFLLLTIKEFGDPGYLDYWQHLKANGVKVVDGWETAYYTNFSAASGHGPQPMVVSYASSPAAEVVFSEAVLTDAPTASIVGPGTCFRQVEFVGILKGTPQADLARRFIDFMLGPSVQADVALQMFVYPVRSSVALPDAFTRYAQTPSEPVSLPADEIARNREAWIDAWTQIMLR